MKVLVGGNFPGLIKLKTIVRPGWFAEKMQEARIVFLPTEGMRGFSQGL